MKRLAGFLAVAFALAASLAAVGYVLLPRFYGPAGARAAILASAVALLGSLAGVVPLFGAGPIGGAGSGGSGAALAGASRFLASMLLRLVAVGLGALAVALLGAVSLEPFLLWLGFSYLALLVVDTALTLTVFRSL